MHNNSQFFYAKIKKFISKQNPEFPQLFIYISKQIFEFSQLLIHISQQNFVYS